MMVTMSRFTGRCMFMCVCVHTTGLASPTALQSTSSSKPKNNSLAISKPQEGQFYFKFPLCLWFILQHSVVLWLPVISHCCHVDPLRSFSRSAQLLLQSDLDVMTWLSKAVTRHTFSKTRSECSYSTKVSLT